MAPAGDLWEAVEGGQIMAALLVHYCPQEFKWQGTWSTFITPPLLSPRLLAIHHVSGVELVCHQKSVVWEACCTYRLIPGGVVFCDLFIFQQY